FQDRMPYQTETDPQCCRHDTRDTLLQPSRPRTRPSDENSLSCFQSDEDSSEKSASRFAISLFHAILRMKDSILRNLWKSGRQMTRRIEPETARVAWMTSLLMKCVRRQGLRQFRLMSDRRPSGLLCVVAFYS